MSAEPDVTRCQECGGYPIHHLDGKCVYPRQDGGPATILTGLAVDLGTISREYFVWGGADKRKIHEVIDRMLADLGRLRALLGAGRQLSGLRALVAEVIGAYELRIAFDATPEDQAQIAAWRERAGQEAGQ